MRFMFFLLSLSIFMLILHIHDIVLILCTLLVRSFTSLPPCEWLIFYVFFQIYLPSVYVNIKLWLFICFCSGPVSPQGWLVSSLEDQYLYCPLSGSRTTWSVSCISASFWILISLWLCFSTHCHIYIKVSRQHKQFIS